MSACRPGRKLLDEMQLIKIRALFARLKPDLKLRGLLYSLIIHLGLFLTYMVLTYTGENTTYDFGTETQFSSMPQTSGKAHKKLSITQAPEKVEQVQKSAEGTEKSSQEAQSEAQSPEDASDIANAADLSFFPNAAAPRMMGSLKQYYPELARQLNVEAAVYLSIVVNKNGKVVKVKVSGVVLSQKLPSEREADLKNKFAAAITRSLKEVRFSAPMIEGKNVPVEMEQVVRYKLN